MKPFSSIVFGVGYLFLFSLQYGFCGRTLAAAASAPTFGIAYCGQLVLCLMHV